MNQPIPVFSGYIRASAPETKVLIDSFYQQRSAPRAFAPLVPPRLALGGLRRRDRDPKKSKAFSFTRFLVPYPLR